MPDDVGSVTRNEVVQACLDQFERPSYLEIGVWKGKTFFRVSAAQKVAVDPKFAFDVEAARAQHSGSEFFEVTSDDYFGLHNHQRKFHVVYLDGLHTLEQTLRDLINAICLLEDDGIIVIDDVYPPTYQASLANLAHSHVIKNAAGSNDKSWMGDVYRLVFFIESFCQQFDYAMTSDNHGQLILWRKTRQIETARTLESIARAPFETIFLEASHLNRMPLNKIVAKVRESRGER